MKGFNYVYGATLLQALASANKAGITKDKFVCITEENGYFCVVYYDDNEGIQ
jgi:hypothetical protein